MPDVYLSPSTQDYNPYIIGGSEKYYMNLLTSAIFFFQAYHSLHKRARPPADCSAGGLLLCYFTSSASASLPSLRSIVFLTALKMFW